jgi:uncharacterized protein YdeI (YjbR/CyaY-like superfamily)
MTPHGLRHVVAAKEVGRWDAACAAIRKSNAASIPKDLAAAIAENPAASKTAKLQDGRHCDAMLNLAMTSQRSLVTEACRNPLRWSHVLLQ